MTNYKDIAFFLELQKQASAIEPGIGPIDIQKLLEENINPLNGGARAELVVKLLDVIPNNPKRILLITSLQLGGAERVAANAVKAIAEKAGKEETLIIATDGDDRTAASWFEPFGQVIILKELIEQPLEKEVLAEILARIINSWQPKAILNINSWAGWRALERYGIALTNQTTWSVGLFCRDQGSNGLPLGHVDRFLRSCISNIERVICDHQGFLDEISNDFALTAQEKQRLKAIYQPVTITKKTLKLGKRVIWAGRLCDQKSPALISQIARLKPEINFDIYSPNVNSTQWKDWGLEAHNIHPKGPYLSFSDLPLEQYGVLLFTSKFEGLPNVLLEAGSNGIPILASAVGGVPELVNQSTGWPVKPSMNDAQIFANNLEEILNNHKEVKKRCSAMYQLLQSRHSNEEYWESAVSSSSFFNLN